MLGRKEWATPETIRENEPGLYVPHWKNQKRSSCIVALFSCSACRRGTAHRRQSTPGRYRSPNPGGLRGARRTPRRLRGAVNGPPLGGLSREGETLEEAKLRFFRNLPKAKEPLRNHQLKLVALLADFDAFCKKSKIKYFLATGTLLGAIRHGGFVPWDDDVDVGMMHDDVDRLIEAALADDRFEVTTLYDQYVFCRQVRFIRAGADANSDPFIDVFIYEYSGCESPDDLQAVKGLRTELMSKFGVLHQRYPKRYALNAYVSEGEVSASIQDVYNRYRAKAAERGLYSDKKDAVSIIWSIENVSYGNPTHIIPIANYKDMDEAQFEGITYPILKNSDILLGKHYGDWLSIPPDFRSHKHYVSLS